MLYRKLFFSLALLLLLSACAAAPSSITVEWTTASEVDTAGFNLYRAGQPEGPFTKLNANLIPASPDPITGGKYKYEDANVEAGQTYYYRLDDVELSGTTTSHGPIRITAVERTPGASLVLAGGGLLIAAGVVVALRLRRRPKPGGEQVVG